MESIVALPLKVLVTLINIILATTTYVIAFTVKMALTLVASLAPFASAVLFFVSNDTLDKATLVLNTDAEKKTIQRISTPEDGKWFSQFFESNPEIEKVSYKDGKMVMLLPKEEAEKDPFVRVNLYSLR